ncbi:Bestrophin, RFP-TM, chloride channel [Tautonia plasticadhaerens]|uniref:Bestrophin, RFP-TM, chloride channel n=2 Tax=Tautonia plasticadhaerens TaxID=2527974 RepID=A0A518H0V4_9BACT|nr:Bestrophin, RFP-TM, chloride channel [Tautonia plasticadhaerens]
MDPMSRSNDHYADVQGRPLRYSFWAGALQIRGAVTLRVLGDVISFGVLSALVVLASRYAEHRFDIHVGVTVGPFEAAGTVLGLLLVLRSNAGYDRWWEARKLWGGIVNQSRNLASSALCYGPDDEAWRTQFIRWAAAFPHVMRSSLRGRRSLPEVAVLLGEAEADRIASADHMPDVVAVELARMLREARDRGMDPMAFYQAEHQRGLLVDHLGGCERILATPLARSSAIQVRRFILLFLSSLPFALLHEFQADPDMSFMDRALGSYDWLIPLYVMLVSYPLLSLDRIGMELQNPFDTRRIDHLPIDDICSTIERNLLGMLLGDPSGHGPHPAALGTLGPNETHIS